MRTAGLRKFHVMALTSMQFSPLVTGDVAAIQEDLAAAVSRKFRKCIVEQVGGFRIAGNDSYIGVKEAFVTKGKDKEANFIINFDTLRNASNDSYIWEAYATEGKDKNFINFDTLRNAGKDSYVWEAYVTQGKDKNTNFINVDTLRIAGSDSYFKVKEAYVTEGKDKRAKFIICCNNLASSKCKKKVRTVLKNDLERQLQKKLKSERTRFES